MNQNILELQKFLLKRSSDFIIINKNRVSIVAGYPWFEDWGRDTFISFRGLLLTTKRFQIAKNILLDWSKYIKYGLIPNRPGLNEYNSLDATLWYIISVYYYWEETKDDETIKKLLPPITNIIKNLLEGTIYGIGVQPSGFLETKDNMKSLTWMDAIVENKPVTPRTNTACEIQMLWYNSLIIYSGIVKSFKPNTNLQYIELLTNTLRESFNKYFWLDSYSWTVDHIKDGRANFQIRPNAVIGFSLPFKIIDDKKASIVLKIIEAELYTPVGLKTLSKNDPDYIGEYSGNQKSRDLAYHNGTIWPWLLGFYLKSYLNVYGLNDQSKSFVEKKLSEFWQEIKRQELNYLPEVFSADNLKPNGCLSQAWNYATMLEVLDILN